RHLFGTPFFKERGKSQKPPTCLMYWEYQFPCPRRPGFPSWSQLGWQGTILFCQQTMLSCPMEPMLRISNGHQSYSLESLIEMDTTSYRAIYPTFSRLLEVST
ncbi:hypothetical protein CC86DRAFT_279762, partial [Ophiobolus disseminans]